VSRPLLLAACLFALAACNNGTAGNNETIDDQVTAQLAQNGAATANDPALRAALRDEIMVDPTLIGRANADAVRPPVEPYAANVPPDGIATTAKPPETDRVMPAPAAKSPCPQCAAAKRALTLGALAEAQGKPYGQCAGAVGYSATWATRLPAAIPLYPQATVIEAAGADGAGCALRIVSFRSTAAPQRLLDWYYTRARAAGFGAQHQADGGEHVLAATKPGGGAMMLLVRAGKDGGSDADLMVDTGS
jgi:hypothetical protein